MTANVEYWTRHTVATRDFATRAQSLAFVEWRNGLNLYREELMPVTGHDGKVILDYGCGTGNGLVNLVEYSRPRELVGVDISPKAIELCTARMALHPSETRLKLLQIPDGGARLPFEDATFDYIHCDGVIHHTPNPEEIIAEFVRLLKPGGEARVYAYHYDSIWLHYYVAYETQVKNGRYRDLTARQAFRHCTDGEECPISNCYTASEFIALAERGGMAGARMVGSGVVFNEMQWVQNRFEAIASLDLAQEHRAFLRNLTFDARGLPYSNGVAAGSSAFYAWVKP
jgi:ubiquinone/menaquinone biosynthesis C-methylase UbiE